MLSGPIEKITFDDVTAFLSQKHREGVGLDYKEDFPKSLEKTICAMANSYGGTIVIGVADADGYPAAESKGIPLNDGHAERVARITVDNIFPPLNPQVAICKKDEQCFVVIRVPQGRETPYTVRSNRVYIRTGLVNTPDDLATLERISWISRGREKAAEHRKAVIQAMASRARNREAIAEMSIPFGVFSMSFGPLFPYEAFFSDKDMPKLRDKVSVHGYGGTFPGSIAKARTVQGGISYFEYRKPTGDFKYLEINKFGYLYYMENMGQQTVGPEGQEKNDRRVEAFRIVRAIDYLINAARKFYALGGYPGELRLTVQGDKLLKIPVRPFPHPGRYDREDLAEPSIDDQLLFFQDWSATDLATVKQRAEKISQIGREIAFSFGFPYEENYIREMLAGAAAS